MNCRYNDLRRKEVISEIDGPRLGYVDDIIVDTTSSMVVAFVIFARIFFFGIFGKTEEYIIPWEKIKLIGEDTILIGCKTPKPENGAKNGYFSGKIKIFSDFKDSADSTTKRLSICESCTRNNFLKKLKTRHITGM